jgi:hypothetical protein
VISNAPEKLQECFGLLVDSILALQRENKEILWGSMVKETMKRKRPSFNETYYGFRTFSHLLEDAQKRLIVILRRDQRSGSYIVEDLGTAASTAAPHATPTATSVAVPAPATAGASTAATPEAAAATAPREAAENGTDSARGGPRRRRSRGRRSRSGGAGSTGAFTEGSQPGGGHEGHDADDHDEGDDEPMSAGSQGDTPRGPDPEPRSATEAPAQAAPAAAGDRSPFSFFSWIRRDPAPERPPERDPDDSEPHRGQ